MDNKDADCCKWKGVECEQTTGRVIGLDLKWTRNQQLGDLYLNALFFLRFTELKILDLSRNHLVGFLENQGWCELKNLERLYLYGNRLKGSLPACLGNFSSLQVLDISANQFVGNLASSPLINLKSLRYLSIASNQFEVPISFNSFMNHSAVEHISCDNNNLIAEPTFQNVAPKFQLQFFSLSNCSSRNLVIEMPNFLYSQYSLRSLDLSHNNFGGSFPSWLIANNTGLQVLKLGDNSFTSPFQMPYHPNYNLTTLDLSENNLQMGRIPSEVCSIFPGLGFLQMADVGITGSIPPCLGNMSYLEYLDLSDNQLSGGIQEVWAIIHSLLIFVKLSNNNLDGEISPSVFNLTFVNYLLLDGNNFTGSISNTWSRRFSPLMLDISNNHLSGKLPSWIGNLSSLQALDLSLNHFEGPIPEHFCKLDYLILFDLSNNNLSGSLPSGFNSSYLSRVHLRRNQLGGPLTNSFSNSTSLVTLDLSHNMFTGSIPNWIASLPKLSFLLLRANQFDGDLPGQLCLMKQLSILDLSLNKLSGPLPFCLSNLTFQPTADISVQYLYQGESLPEGIEFTTKRLLLNYEGGILNFMKGIDLSSNRLTGNIPPEIGNMSEIRALNLSHNDLSGSIPSTFSKLVRLESLDLSFNNLNGRIPHQLTELISLAIFSVAYNNLSGRTPEMKYQFGTFDESSYEGNPFLCGPPLQNDCIDPVPEVSSNEREDSGFIDMDSFLVIFGVSYIAVVFGISAVLCINPYWRRAWFYFIELCIDCCYSFVLKSFRKLSNFR